MKKILKYILLIILLPVLYVGGNLVSGTITDFQPKEIIEEEIKAIGDG